MHTITCFVPSTTRDRTISQSQFENRIRETLIVMADQFGGAFSQESMGSYLDQAGRLIIEKVALCQSYVIGLDSAAIEKRYAHMLEYARKKVIDWQQESILIAADDREPALVFANQIDRPIADKRLELALIPA